MIIQMNNTDAAVLTMATTTSTTTTYYTIDASNYHRGIPDNETNVMISADVNQSLYQEICKGLDEHGHIRPVKDDDKLINVKLHDSITEIQDKTFYNCRLIESIVLPPKLTRIGFKAFDNCVNMSILKLPETLRVIDESAFFLLQQIERS